MCFSKNEPDKYRLYRGHFYGYLNLIVKKPLKKFIFLRDPIERALSHYAHIMRAEEHYLYDKTHELGSLKRFLEDPVCRETVRNFQAKTLIQKFNPFEIAKKLNSEEIKKYHLEMALETAPWAEEESELLDKACAELDIFEVIGITEHFEESLELLFATFGWKENYSEHVKANIGENRIRLNELDDEVKALLIELNKVDLELYKQAVGKFSHQLAKKRGLSKPTFRYLVEGGGYRTGSTLQYNLVGTYLENIGYGRRISNTPPDEISRLQGEFIKTPEMILVTKTHHVMQCLRSFKNPTAWTDLLEAGEAKAMVTNREFGAVKRSMIRKFKIEEEKFEESIYWIESVANSKRFRELGAWEQEYDLLVENPVKALQDFCEAFAIPFIKAAADSAATSTSKEAHRKIMQNVPDGTFDRITLLFGDHINQ